MSRTKQSKAVPKSPLESLTPEELSFGPRPRGRPASGDPNDDGPGPAYRARQCRHGTFVYNARDIFIGRSLDLYGEYVETEVAFLMSALKPGSVVVQAGANLGADTVPLARRVGPHGWIVAIEPQRLVHQLLCANLALNRITNVVAPWCALGAKAGEAVVPPLDYEQPGNFGGVALLSQGHGERVPVVTIDSFDLPRCDLITADVEGMERDVLLGASNTIIRHRPRLYVENNGQGDSAALIEHVLGLGYRAWWHLPTLFNPRNHVGRRENVFANIVSCNMFCLPPDDQTVILGMRPVSGPQDLALPKPRSRRPAVDDSAEQKAVAASP